MKLLWAVDGFWKGSAYGMSVHRDMMKKALLAAGVTLCFDPNEDFDIAVHFTRPDYFKPIPGKRNILFTATEFTEPCVWSERINEATALVLPCEHSRKVCSRWYPGPVFTCPEGIDETLFTFFPRQYPDPQEPFRFLYVGNGGFEGSRKGLDIMMSAWMSWARSFHMPSNVQLYVKTTDMLGPELQYLNAASFWLQAEKPELPGIIFDTRTLKVAELVELYQSAHAFVLPSRGEGWGLTLTDAMATGLPCIWTHWSAPLDYADETTGFPIPEAEFKMGAIYPGKESGAVLKPTFGAEIKDDDSVVRRMEAIYHNYPAALVRGKAASERMHSRYTWAQAAKHFIEICREAMSLPTISEKAVDGVIAKAKDEAMAQSQQMLADLQAQGDPTAMTKVQAWYRESIEKIDQTYGASVEGPTR